MAGGLDASLREARRELRIDLFDSRKGLLVLVQDTPVMPLVYDPGLVDASRYGPNINGSVRRNLEGREFFFPPRSYIETLFDGPELERILGRAVRKVDGLDADDPIAAGWKELFDVAQTFPHIEELRFFGPDL